MRDIGIVKSQDGVSLLTVAICMVVLLGMAALSIDVGMLYTAKGQAQNAADAGALAGAGALMLSTADATTARLVAESFAEKHEIIRETVAVEPAADVDVDLVNQRVTVTVRRIQARGNAVPTFFAKILGWDVVDIQATATAVIGCGSSSACMKPWAIPDAFDDVDLSGGYNEGDYYESGVTSYGTTYRNPEADFGTQLILKHSLPNEAIAPGQFFPVDLPLPGGGPTTGGDRYRENIATCNGQIVSMGNTLPTESGNMIGPTAQGVQDLIALDPDAWWDSTLGVMNSAYPPGASPRIVTVPMFDPRYPPTSGKVEVLVTNIAGMFIEGVSPPGKITGRLMPVAGMAGGVPCLTSLLKTVQLVE